MQSGHGRDSGQFGADEPIHAADYALEARQQGLSLRFGHRHTRQALAEHLACANQGLAAH